MRARIVHALSLLSFAALAACGGPPPAQPSPKVDLPLHVLSTPPKTTASTAQAPARQAPPGPLASKDASIPRPTRSTLASGLPVAVIESHALPIAQVRVLVRAGNGYGNPAVARVTADLLKDGGTATMTSADLLRRVETLGSDLGIDVRMDSTVLSLAVPKDALPDALAILGEVVASPRFDAGEMKKLTERLVDESESKARQSGGFMATRLAFAQIETGPYSHWDVLASEVKKVTLADVKDFHHKFFVAQNMEVIVAGDVDPAQTNALVKKSFGAVRKDAAPAVTFSAPKSIENRRVIVADRPKSVQSDIYVVSLAPERKTPKYPAMRVANQVLGGGVQGRLFADVRESRSLAYSTGSQLVELGEGPELTFATAGTQSGKTVDAVQGILDNLDKIRGDNVSDAENAGARRFLADIFAVRLETLGALADLYVTKDSLKLDDDYYDNYRKELREMTPAQTNAAAKDLFDPSHALVIVAGDASVIAEGLKKFGEVTIVDPEHDFAVTKTLK